MYKEGKLKQIVACVTSTVLTVQEGKREKRYGTNKSHQWHYMGVLPMETFKIINDFLDDHNYKSYYQRTWNKDDKTTVVDVGSWTEFFYIQEV